MSPSYTAIRGRCFRALAPALVGLGVVVGAMASSSAADLPAGLMIADAARAPVAASAVVVVPPPPPPPPEFAFASPLPGRDIGSPFGLRRLPWEPTGRLHEGVDMAAPSGEPVHATCDGTVVRTGTSPSYGRFVEVAHPDGVSSFYAHLGRVAKSVRAGLAVAKGDVVGTVGDSGHSTGAHLHFELRKDGRPMDPTMFIDRTFAKLSDLPLRAAETVSRHVRLAAVSSTPRWTLASAASPRLGRHRVHATVIAAAD